MQKITLTCAEYQQNFSKIITISGFGAGWEIFHNLGIHSVILVRFSKKIDRDTLTDE
jgi:hypothetical protein